MDLQYYKNQKEIRNNQINGIITVLKDTELSSADLAHTVKALEIMGNPQTWHDDLLSELSNAVSRLALLAATATDRLYVSRSIAVCKATQNCNDADHIDLHNDVEIGTRRFDCFGDRKLEKYYEEYKSC